MGDHDDRPEHSRRKLLAVTGGVLSTGGCLGGGEQFTPTPVPSESTDTETSSSANDTPREWQETASRTPSTYSGDHMNVLLITADDLGTFSPGFMGGETPEVTPALDRFARDNHEMTHFCADSPLCGPNRASIHTGHLVQNHGHMGHGAVPPDWWTSGNTTPSGLTTVLQAAGVLTGRLNKNGFDNNWDYSKNNYQLGAGRNWHRYYEYAREFIESADSQNQPFFLEANIKDPHRYWAGSDREAGAWTEKRAERIRKEMGTVWKFPNGKPWPAPPRTYTPEEVDVPPQYPDDPEVRTAMSYYFNSVRRMDRVFEAVLQALEDSGAASQTVVMFLSDHGLPWPFGKWSLYQTGIRTPLLVRWPGVTSDSRDTENVGSTIDLMPTILDVYDMDYSGSFDGQSLVPLFENEGGWDVHIEVDGMPGVMTQWNWQNIPEEEGNRSEYSNDIFAQAEPDAGEYRPSRGIYTPEYTYIWNAWPDGELEVPRSMGTGTEIMTHLDKGTEQSADPDTEYPEYKERAEFYRTRSNESLASLYDGGYGNEELYHNGRDPGNLNNLVHDNEHQSLLESFRSSMLSYLEDNNDWETENFRTFINRQ